jgi:hypothetical protein
VVKASLIAMLVLTVLIAMGLRWREQRAPVVARGNMVARGKRTINRWVTAAALAALVTMVFMGGLHWLRLIRT